MISEGYARTQLCCVATDGKFVSQVSRQTHSFAIPSVTPLTTPPWNAVVLQNPNVYYPVHKNPPLFLIQSQMNPFNILIPFIFKIYFNFNLSFTTVSQNVDPSFIFKINYIHTYQFPHMYYKFIPSYSLLLILSP